MPPPTTKTHVKHQGQGLDQTQKLKNIDLDLVATPPWTMEFMATLVEVTMEKTKHIIIRCAIGGCPMNKDVNECIWMDLHASFQKVKLLTHGVFEVIFHEERGALET
jgi:hypothetical protein